MLANQLSSPSSSDAGPVLRKRILLVDDHRAKRDSPALVLCESGYAVDWARSAAEARCRWSPHLYHLVVINLGRDAFDGALLCHELKEDQPRQLVATISGEASCPPAAFPADAVIRVPSRAKLLAAVKFLLAA